MPSNFQPLARPLAEVCLYHEFAPGRGVQGEMNGRGRIKGLVADGVPSLMFGGIDVATFFEHQLHSSSRSVA